MSITLTYQGDTSLPVEIEGLTPDWAWDKSLAEIERFEIFHGNRKLPLAEMFSVTGDPSDKRFDFEGNLAGVHWIGASMRDGQIHIHGPAGRHVGSELRGGEIHIEGDVGDWCGCEMRGGTIHVRGNAGNQLGAAYRGSAQGMRGGTIIVEGNAGHEVGLLMNEGIIAIGGRAGDMIGFNKLAGLVIVLGDAGSRPGAGMHGGTIVLLGPTPSPVLPSFRFDRTVQSEVLFPALEDLREKGLPFDETKHSAEMSVFIGDLIEAGTGAIYVRGRAAAETESSVSLPFNGEVRER
jgi:formylmethanofuran dehydrogenase subunit C